MNFGLSEKAIAELPERASNYHRLEMRIAELCAVLGGGSVDSKIDAAERLGAALADPSTSAEDRERALAALLAAVDKLDRRRAGEGTALRHVVAALGKGPAEPRAIEPLRALFKADLRLERREGGRAAVFGGPPSWSSSEGMDDDEELIDEVAASLAALGARTALPALRAALLDEDFELHERAIARAIATIGGAAEEETLLDAVASQRPDLVRAALEGLRMLGTSVGEPGEQQNNALVELAAGDDPDLAIDARLTLAILDPERAKDAVAVVAEAQGLSAQSEILRVLAEPAARSISACLLAALFDPAWNARRFDAAELLCRHGSREVLTWLSGAATDTLASPWQRLRAAVISLGVEFDEGLFDQVVEGITRPRDPHLETSELVRDTVVLAVETLPRALAQNPEALADWLRLVLELAREEHGTDAEVTHAARASLAQVVGPSWERDFERFVERLLDD
ncbi:MAG: hypothetical protein U0271_47770 [Polyangiaceae bacterium]